MVSDRYRRFSDILLVSTQGKLRVPPEVHHLKGLLEMEPEEVLARFKASQIKDFTRAVEEFSIQGTSIHNILSILERHPAGEEANPLSNPDLIKPERLLGLFTRLHDHVMDHPVWRHPFFFRIFRGEFELEQLKFFAVHYFNQIKNTRQCVALSLGRFHSLQPRKFGFVSERISELTQIVLAQLLADEYGVSTESIEKYPGINTILSSRTHIAIYRKLFTGLNIPFPEQERPLLHGVADNVLIQRLVAGSDAFTEIESLASVGLGMEWGVPEFFSLLLGGIIRFAHREKLGLTRDQLEVFIAHVKYDVLHAVSVMLATALHTTDQQTEESVRGAVNILMSGRYTMMSDLYRAAFNEPCPGIKDIELAPQYHIHDRRIENELLIARQHISPDTVVEEKTYRHKKLVPFVFREGQ